MSATPLSKFEVTGTRIDKYLGCNIANIVIPSGITEIGHSAFFSMSDPGIDDIKSIFIPDSVTKIGRYAFYHMKNLSTVRLPTNLKRLEERSFSSCPQLAELQLPHGLQYIDYGAISRSSIAKLVLPSSVTDLDEGAFCHCDKLKEITIPDSVRVIGKDAFRDSPNVTIRTTHGSYAAEYALKENIPVVFLTQDEMAAELAAAQGISAPRPTPPAPNPAPQKTTPPKPAPAPQPTPPKQTPSTEPQMTIEEAIQLAESGDIGAMMALGQYYIQQNTGEGIAKAAEWYEAAAKKNVVPAIHMTVMCKKILAYAGIQISGHDEHATKFVMDDWKEVYDWAAKELECINAEVEGADKVNIDDAINHFTEASYFYALTCYWAECFSDVTALLSDFDDTRSRILYGAALIQLAETNAQMENARRVLTSIIKDASYAAADKAAWEEDVYALSALQLSMLYKNNGSQSDLESAVSLLTFVLHSVKNEQNITVIRNELNRYQKKLFGGYKYV